MDQEPEDWEEKKRIKAEIRKAEDADAPESKANLANLQSRDFTTKKGFTREPEAIRQSGERLANAGAVLAVLGTIGSLLNTIQGFFKIACIIALILAIAGLAAAIMYKNKTGKNVQHILITAGFAIALVALNLLALSHI